MPLPALGVSNSEGNSRRPAEDRPVRAKSANKTMQQKLGANDQAQVVKSLCKTYAATTQKLMYVFSTLLEEEVTDAGPTSIDDALHSSSRAMILGEVTSALAAGVEKIIRSSDLSMRSTVLRDLRARFAPNGMVPKVETVEKGTQAVREKPAATVPKLVQSGRISSANAATGRTEHTLDQLLEGEETAHATGVEAKALHSVPIYDRLKAWEARKAERVERERKAQEEREVLPATTFEQTKEGRRRSSRLYAHVESAVKLERQKAQEEESKLAVAEERVNAEVQAREEAVLKLGLEAKERQRVEKSLRASETARHVTEQQLYSAREEIADVQRKYEELQAEAAGTAESLELAECLDGRKLENWPMIPGKRVLRIHPAEDFDGRVSQEYRVKDSESAQRGVAILMGRSSRTRQPEAQCVLFDPKYLSDLEAARWWADNRYRFERAAVSRTAA